MSYSKDLFLGLALIIGFTFAAFPSGGVLAANVADFYAGKTVSMMIGASVGSGYDRYARLVARHMGRHIPGNPAFVSQQMHGAGGMILANHLFNVASRDGAVIGAMNRASPLEPLFGNEAAKFKPTDYLWLGSTNNEVSVCVSWHASGIDSFQAVRNNGLLVAAATRGDDTAQLPNVLNTVLGTKIEVITGYDGTGAMKLAMERGEVQGRCGWSWSSVVTTSQDWISENRIHVLIQMSTSKHPDLAHVPLAMEFADTEEQRQILNLVFSRQTMGRPFAGPPGIPADRARALQEAFMATMRDQDFLSEAKTARLDIAPVSGEEIRALLESVYATPQSVVAAAVAAMQ